MKRNAIFRIVIYSAVILVLLAILFIVLFAMPTRRSSAVDMTATEIPVKTTFPLPETVIATKAVNIRRTPSLLSEVVADLQAGDVVRIGRQEMVKGLGWAYVLEPVSGWVVAEFLGESVPQETGVSVYLPEAGEKSSFHASEISEIEIDWVAGEILIQPGTGDQITVQEDNVTDIKYAMTLEHKSDKLKILFYEESLYNFIGFGSVSDLSKDLTITVPADWFCESLDIECASATVEVNDLTIGEVDFDGASGTCEFENCVIEEIDIDTASGDVRLIGQLDRLDCDAASASVYAVLTNIPSRLDMDMMSGDLDLTLPADAGFALAMDSTTGDFNSDFETTLKNGNYVCGDGRCRINIDALSGDVIIRKGEATSPAAPTAPDAPAAPDAPTAP